MKAPFLLDDAATYKGRIETLASQGWIDPPSNVARARIYFFTGSSDQVVNSETGERIRKVPPQELIDKISHPADLTGLSLDMLV